TDAHLKDLMYANGVLLLVTAKDPNNHLVILGIAIVPVENGEHWTWFLRCLQSAGIPIADTVIVSDRLKGLIKACNDVCPDSPHRYCMRHIVANMNSSLGRHLSSVEESLVYKLPRSDSRESFTRHMDKLQSTNAVVATYLSHIPVKNWVTYAFPRPTFDNFTSNLSESANQWLGTELRSSDAVTLYFRYMYHLLKNINERST
ncbi:hypothetical protein AaE_008001, partial [Aphanomyces astaci]